MAQYALFFITYSFLGWVLESVFRSVVEKGRPVNSGFLTGPFIPVYGFGALATIVLGSAVSSLPFFLQLIVFTLAATVLEYVTSVLLERIFTLKLWDYSNYPINDTYHIRFPLNINGRVCLFFSLFWAGLITLQVTYLNPLVFGVIGRLEEPVQYLVLFLFTVYLSIDLYFSARLYYRFAHFLASVRASQVGRLSALLQSRLFAMRIFLRPLRAFPALRDQLSRAWMKLPDVSKIQYIKDIKVILQEKLPLLHSERKTGCLRDFYELAEPIIHHPRYQQLKEIKHHDKDIYTHNLSVAWISFFMARKLHLHVAEVVRGALLHDFFFYDWRTYRDKDYFLPHGFSHPKISYKNAVKTFGALSPREKDIILKHMWPLTVVPPRYIESLLVSLVDKTIASKETIRALMPGRKKGKRADGSVS